MMKKTTRRGEPPWGARWWPDGCPRPGTSGWDSLPWPVKIPVLIAADVIRQHQVPLTSPPYNLDGWLEAAFEPEGFWYRDRSRWVAYAAEIALEVCLSKLTGVRTVSWTYMWREDAVAATAAAVWNEAMELLGYDLSKDAGVDDGDGYGEYFS